MTTGDPRRPGKGTYTAPQAPRNGQQEPKSQDDAETPEEAKNGQTQPPEPPKNETPAEVVVPPELLAAGWRPFDGIKKISILYGMVRVGSNFSAVRLELKKDGSVLALAMPENMKGIAADRLLDLMLTEIQ